MTCPPGRAQAAVSSARLAEALDWSLARLGDALAALDAQLADTGLRIDHDPAAMSPEPGPGSGATRPEPAPHRHPTRRAAPAPRPAPGLDVESARLLYAIAHDPRAITERHLAYDPAAVVALQQRGLVRRHPGGGYLELTEAAHYGLAADPAPPAP